MQDFLDNREQGNRKSRGKKPKVGRPKAADRKPEVDREILHTDGKTTIERCQMCGKNVKMRVYTKKDNIRYCGCPSCGRRVAIRGLTIRSVD